MGGTWGTHRLDMGESTVVWVIPRPDLGGVTAHAHADLLQALYANREPVGYIVREIDIDVGEGRIAVCIVAEHATQYV